MDKNDLGSFVDRLARGTRTWGTPAAVAAGSMFGAAQAQAEEPRTAPVFEGSIAQAYTAENNYCPTDMIENGMVIGGSKAIKRLNDLLDVFVKRAVFGTDDLTKIGANTININVKGDDVHLATGGTELSALIAYGTNVVKQDSGIGVFVGAGDAYVLVNTNNQNVQSEMVTVPAAYLAEVRNATCTIREEMVAQGHPVTILGPDGIPIHPDASAYDPDGQTGASASSTATGASGSDGSGTPADASTLPNGLLESGLERVIEGPSYHVATGLPGHAVSAEVSINDVLSNLPLSRIDGYSISFEAGHAAVSQTDDGYVLVAALPGSTGVHTVATISVDSEGTRYTIPLTARANPAPEGYEVSVGTPENNRILNAAGVNVADVWKTAVFKLQSGDVLDYQGLEEAAASESRRGFTHAHYDPNTNELTLGYELGGLFVAPRGGLTALELAINNSNQAQVLGVGVEYVDAHAIMTGAYDPRGE
jgi:hypothetical protein